MNDASKRIATAAAFATALAGSAALGRFTATAAAPVSVAPLGVRWMGPTSDANHPYYYGVIFNVRQGATQATRETTCPTDGNPPSLDGYPYHAADQLCADTIAYGAKVAADIDALTSTIALSNAPDMAQPSPVDAGQ